MEPFNLPSRRPLVHIEPPKWPLPSQIQLGIRQRILPLKATASATLSDIKKSHLALKGITVCLVGRSIVAPPRNFTFQIPN